MMGVLGLSNQEFIYCFGHSKMTIVNEKNIISSLLYMQLEFVEFTTLIGYAAYCKYQGTNSQ
jgi:hypothetical protein